MQDLLIRNVRIVDGMGKPALTGSPVIDGQAITAAYRGDGGPSPVK